jgi:hypothetical protein
LTDALRLSYQQTWAAEAEAAAVPVTVQRRTMEAAAGQVPMAAFKSRGLSMDLNKTKIPIPVTLKIVVAACGIVIVAYQTFATMKYVDDKHAGVVMILDDFKERLIRIENKQDDILRRSRHGK